MDKDFFHMICRTAFGENYTTDVAAGLSVSDRTVRSWRNGERTIPENMGNELVDLLTARRVELEELLEKIISGNVTSQK